MTLQYLPKELSEVLKQQFSFPKQPLFGAVATICMQDQIAQSRVRTMRIYDLTQQGCPILLTHVSSNKWREFLDHPQLSICMVSENKLTQIIVHGTIQLDTIESAPEKAKQYWPLVRIDVKKIYHASHAVGEAYNEPTCLDVPRDIPNTFGIGCLIPTFWELLSLTSEYTASCRIQFQLKNGAWLKQRVNVG